MKLHRLLLALAALAVVGTVAGEARADGFHGRSSLPWFGYGFSGSLYGLGRLPVPPYYAIHPPVYYSLPQARPYGHSPFAYSGNYHPPLKVRRRIIHNPHIESLRLPETAPLPEPDESSAEAATSTARLILNPFYAPNQGSQSQLAAQSELPLLFFAPLRLGVR